MNEEWRPVKDSDGEYMVSNIGRVMSLKRKTPHIMPQTIQPSGRGGKLTYYAVTLWMNNKAKCRKVHRMVAEAFIPNPDNLPCINHKDGNKLNNNVSNLEWCTYQENMQHAVRTGLTHPHRWTEEERKYLSERGKQYAVDHGYQPKPKRTWAEYQAERKRKAEELKAERAKQPKPPRKRGGWKWSDEARQAASERAKGKPHPRKSGTKGWKWSDEARQRVTGKPHPQRLHTKGWKWSDEARQKFSEKQKERYAKRRGSE